MLQAQFQDQRFEQPGQWSYSYLDEHFEQRFLEDDPLIFCETRMTVHGAPALEDAVALIRGPWDWWEHGKISDYEESPDGTTFQTLAPVWWFITRVGLRIETPVELAGGGVRIPMTLSNDFTGPSTIDLLPGRDGGRMVVRGRFHGVESHVAAAPVAWAEALHLEAESGTMPLPFPKGTGWAGLLRRLEAGAHRVPVS